MSEVMPRDVLLRISPKMLEKYQSLCVAGAGRGRAVPLPYTFTRAAVRRVRGHDGTGRKFAADKVAISYPAGLVDQFANPVAAIRFDGARTQLVTDPENFGAWDQVGTPVLTSGQADPFGGTAAYLVEDNDGAAAEYIRRTVTYTGNATKAQLGFVRAGSAATTEFALVADGFGQRVRITVTWTAGVASVAVGGGSGTARAVPWGGGWYLIEWMADGVLAAEVNRYTLFPAGQTAANTGTVYIFGANAWDAPFPSSYQGPGESAGAADSLTVGFNFGPLPEMTVLARVARPAWADASGNIGTSPGIFQTNTNPRIGIIGIDTTRAIKSFVLDAAGDQELAQTAIPAGAELNVAGQWRITPTTADTRFDIGDGAGYSAFSTGNADGFTAFGSQVLQVGRITATEELYGDLIDLVIARGLFSRAEILAVSNA